jgi:hypothetical protein
MGCTILFKRRICRDTRIQTTNNLVHGFQEYKQTIWFMDYFEEFIFIFKMQWINNFKKMES